MTVIYQITEVQKREGDNTEPDKIGGQRNASLRRTFRISADRDGVEVDIMANAGIPQPYAQHPNAPGFVVKSRRCSRIEKSSGIWEATIDYLPKSHEDDDEPNPINQRRVLSVDTEDRQEIIKIDLDGKHFDTAAGEPLEEIPLWERGHCVYTLTRNEPFFDPASIYPAYLKTVCSHGLFGWPGGCAFMRRIAASEEYDAENDITYAKVTYVIAMRDYVPNANSGGGDISAWKVQLRNAGYRFKGDDGKLSSIEPRPAMPFDLKLDGKKLPVDDPATYLTFQGYRETSWHSLGLDR